MFSSPSLLAGYLGWNVEGAISFVLSRETDEGGFSFAETTPRTVDDTYHALRTFELLGYGYESDKTLRYVQGLDLDRYTPPRRVWETVQMFRLLGADLDHRLSDQIVTRLCSSPDLSYGSLYFLLSSLPHLPHAPEVGVELRFRVSDPSIPSLRTMDNVLRQLLLMRQLDMDIDGPMYAEWVRRAQNGDGGFGFYPGTTSFLENTYYALRALDLLGSEPIHFQRCEEFVQRCQIAGGGFGRQMITVPRVDSTHHAVASLLILERMST